MSLLLLGVIRLSYHCCCLSLSRIKDPIHTVTDNKSATLFHSSPSNWLVGVSWNGSFTRQGLGSQPISEVVRSYWVACSFTVCRLPALSSLIFEAYPVSQCSAHSSCLSLSTLPTSDLSQQAQFMAQLNLSSHLSADSYSTEAWSFWFFPGPAASASFAHIQLTMWQRGWKRWVDTTHSEMFWLFPTRPAWWWDMATENSCSSTSGSVWIGTLVFFQSDKHKVFIIL